MRNITPEIWTDDWFAEQEPIGKLVWIGIITRVSDDQGRFRHNAELVKSQLFPMSAHPTATEVDLWLATFIKDERLIPYEASGKKLLQVRNWWKHQGNANWMKASEYPAPPMWADWYKYQTKAGVVDSHKAGGVEKPQAGIQGYLVATQQATQQGGYVNINDNVNVNHNSKDDEKNPFQFYTANIALLTSYTSDELKELCEEYTDEWVIDALKVSVENNARSLRYARAVLEGWKAHHKGWKPGDDKAQGRPQYPTKPAVNNRPAPRSLD
jgi:DnaD/phage-associated family protein